MIFICFRTIFVEIILINTSRTNKIMLLMIIIFLTSKSLKVQSSKYSVGN